MLRVAQTLFILMAIAGLYGCRPQSKKKAVSFYYWQQANNFSDSTDRLITGKKISRFYVHLMDVVWNAEQQRPLPVAVSALSEPNPIARQELVPVVFIHNEVVDKTDGTELPALAGNIISAARAFLEKSGSHHLTELQLDCDWTPKTRDRYFHLLQLLKQASPETVYSATIRLYPYKYDNLMGVPPVDYGVLMIYNLAPVRDIKTVNSIFTYNEFKKYKRTAVYPIPLKPILPVFGWYAWFRGGNYKGILYGSPDLISMPFFEQETATKFRITKDTVMNGQYIRSGDVLRNEFPDRKELSAVSKNLDNLLPGSEEIIFYYWNESFLQHYAPVIQEITAR